MTHVETSVNLGTELTLRFRRTDGDKEHYSDSLRGDRFSDSDLTKIGEQVRSHLAEKGEASYCDVTVTRNYDGSFDVSSRADGPLDTDQIERLVTQITPSS